MIKRLRRIDQKIFIELPNDYGVDLFGIFNSATRLNEYATFLKSSVFHLILHRQKCLQRYWYVTVVLQPHKFMRRESSMMLLIFRRFNGGDAF